MKVSMAGIKNESDKPKFMAWMRKQVKKESSEILFIKQKEKMQKFYNKWLKPVKDSMTPDMLADMEHMIEKYELTR